MAVLYCAGFISALFGGLYALMWTEDHYLLPHQKEGYIAPTDVPASAESAPTLRVVELAPVTEQAPRPTTKVELALAA